jgi:hypothetical protein
VQVNDDDVAGWMDPDRQAIGEVANPSLITLTDAQMRATECELELGDTDRSSQSQVYAVIFVKFAGRVHVMY